MQLIVLSRDRGHVGQLDLRGPKIWLGISGLALALVALAFFAGFKAAANYGVVSPAEEVALWRESLDAQRAQVNEAKQATQEYLDALALRLGKLNAHVIRLDALGGRLTQMADLDADEFDFGQSPSLGGPEVPLAASGELPDLLRTLDQLDDQVRDREQKLEIVEDLLLNRELAAEVVPKGMPVKSGYISSFFGKRTDPFTGRPAWHKGVDFAGKEGADIVAVAAGVVTWSGPRYGYGELVEVTHGNGYATRYAHNAENLVAVGDRVEKGQLIAKMGSTGRATGPNLHFEVLHGGLVVNPVKFVRAEQ